MTTQLAIGYRAAPSRNAATGRPLEPEVVDSRPAIPHAVITWTDEEVALPLGAGDPATSIAGPAPFRVLPVPRKQAGRLSRLGVDAVMFGALVAMLVGLAAAVATSAGDPQLAWTPKSSAALLAWVPPRTVVEVKELRSEPSEAPAGTVAAPAPIIIAGPASAAPAAAAAN